MGGHCCRGTAISRTVSHTVVRPVGRAVGECGALRPGGGLVTVHLRGTFDLAGLAQQSPVVGLICQVIVGAGGDDASAVHDGDAVGAAHGSRPVGDDQDGAVLDQGAQCLLDLGLGLGVGHGGGLVKHDDGGVQQDGAGDGDALLLPTRQCRVLP